MVLIEVAADRSHLFPLFFSPQNTLIDIASNTERTVSRCSNEKRSSANKTIPDEMSVLCENLIGHERSEFGTCGSGSDVVSFFKIEAIVGVSLTISEEGSEIDVFDCFLGFVVMQNTRKGIRRRAEHHGALEGEVRLELKAILLLLVRSQCGIKGNNVQLPTR